MTGIAGLPAKARKASMDFYPGLVGVLFIAGGIYGWLLALGRLQIAPQDPEKSREWREKYGGMMRWAGPVMILYGVFRLSGAF